MDSLWRTPTFSNFDLELFSFQEDSQPGARCVRIYTDSTLQVCSRNEQRLGDAHLLMDLQATDWLKKDEARSLDQWTSWFQKVSPRCPVTRYPARGSLPTGDLMPTSHLVLVK